MYLLNKIVWFFVNPVVVPLVGAIVGALLLGIGKSRARRVCGGWLLALALALLWFESTIVCVCLLGMPLERPYLATQRVETLPQADAIVLLGGGVGKVTQMAYPDMFEGADRVWHAARLWKAGKAPKIVVSGSNDLSSTIPLLQDLGVAREAIIVDNKSRNTYENSRFTEKLLATPEGKPVSVLLVTSAWHMPRASGNFAKTSIKVIPAACDFSAHNAWYGITSYAWYWVAPTAESMARTNYLFKEWLGRLAKK